MTEAQEASRAHKAASARVAREAQMRADAETQALTAEKKHEEALASAATERSLLIAREMERDTAKASSAVLCWRCVTAGTVLKAEYKMITEARAQAPLRPRRRRACYFSVHLEDVNALGITA